MKIDVLNNLFISFFNFINSGIYNVIPNKNVSYGLAIIFLTIIIKLLLLPLNIKQIKSSLAMSEVGPELKVIQNKYKNDPQKVQQETMKLYKEKGVNPLGGCLPLLIQWPILIALYYVFYNLHGINGVSFLWIKDLSKAASIKDVTSWILPIISGGTTYISGMLMSSKDADSAQVKQTTTMNIVMSVMLLWMSFSFKAALVLYWTISNIFQIGQTKLVKALVENKKRKAEAN